jgi:hypothetical protein
VPAGALRRSSSFSGSTDKTKAGPSTTTANWWEDPLVSGESAAESHSEKAVSAKSASSASGYVCGLRVCVSVCLSV